jgi:chaperone modulatory protein CbpM
MRTGEFLLEADIGTQTLEVWIEAGWLRPQTDRSGLEFSDIDLARARLISDLRGGLGVNDEAIPIVLDLIDQIHGLRRLVRELAERDHR